MRRAREPGGQIFPDISTEESRHSIAAVLPDVRELVRQQSGRGRGAGGDSAIAGRSEKHATPEDDRVRSGDGRQETREAAPVKPGAEELVLERGEKAVGDFRRDAHSGDSVMRGLRFARRTPGTYDPKSDRRSEAICFNSTV